MPNATPTYECEDCDWTGSQHELAALSPARAKPGPLPDGACPKCGAPARIAAELQTFSVEFEWWIPRLVHQEIEAESVEDAVAQVKGLMAEDAIDYEAARDIDDACTDTQFTGIWVGGPYEGDNLLPHAIAKKNAARIGGQMAPGASFVYPAIDPAAPNMSQALAEALQYGGQAFDDDAEVNGAELVEWFAGWRKRAQAALEGAAAGRKTVPPKAEG